MGGLWEEPLDGQDLQSVGVKAALLDLQAVDLWENWKVSRSAKMMESVEVDWKETWMVFQMADCSEIQLID
jgi:hypothetical protein